MSLLALVLLPALLGLLALAAPATGARRALLVGGALLQSALVAAVLAGAGTGGAGPGTAAPTALGGWLALDALGTLFLATITGLFLVVSLHAQATVRGGGGAARAFVPCLFWFLAAMTLVTLSQHVGVLWVGVEATTLASAPLVYHHRDAHALEAAWKYLLLCSVGIALALLGTFLLALAAGGARGPVPLTVSALVAMGPSLDRKLLAGAFVFLFVGYGTKMGLAPLHTWLPDAHSQAPAAASALLSGALLSCAFLALLRGWQVCMAAGLGPFAARLFVFFGLLSLALSAAFIVGQTDYKRLLAYSSMEHMGVLALGVGIGGAATYGAMLHALNHSLAKGLLFLVAGNILAVYGSRATSDVRGVLRRLPGSGILLLVGFFALAESPPFGLFISEITILRGILEQGRWAVAAIYLAALAAVFAGMSSIVLRMAQGQPSEEELRATEPERWSALAPPLLLAAAVLLLGLWIPAPLDRLLHAAAALLGGGRHA
jgi:hydrogenase-4 component F